MRDFETPASLWFDIAHHPERSRRTNPKLQTTNHKPINIVKSQNKPWMILRNTLCKLFTFDLHF